MIYTFNEPQEVSGQLFNQIEPITQDYAKLITKEGRSKFIGSISGKNIYSRLIQTLVLTAKKDESDKKASKRISL